MLYTFWKKTGLLLKIADIFVVKQEKENKGKSSFASFKERLLSLALKGLPFVLLWKKRKLNLLQRQQQQINWEVFYYFDEILISE